MKDLLSAIAMFNSDYAEILRIASVVIGALGTIFGLFQWLKNRALRLKQRQLESSGVHLGDMKPMVLELLPRGGVLEHRLRGIGPKTAIRDVMMGVDLPQAVASACENHTGESPVLKLATPTQTEYMYRDLVSWAGTLLPDDAVPHVIVMVWENADEVERRFARPTLYNMAQRRALLASRHSVAEAGQSHQDKRSATDKAIAQMLGNWDPSQPGTSATFKDADGHVIAQLVCPGKACIQRVGTLGDVAKLHTVDRV